MSSVYVMCYKNMSIIKTVKVSSFGTLEHFYQMLLTLFCIAEQLLLHQYLSHLTTALLRIHQESCYQASLRWTTSL